MLNVFISIEYNLLVILLIDAQNQHNLMTKSGHKLLGIITYQTIENAAEEARIVYIYYYSSFKTLAHYDKMIWSSLGTAT